ncbi:MAG: ABC transporter substrate-binding protein [Byssovorax sp.]
MRHEKTLRGRPDGTAGKHLVAWSSLEDYELDDYLSALGQAFPDLTMTLVRSPTGDLAARLRGWDLGEQPPDLLFGTAATVLCEPEITALLAPVEPTAPAAGPERRWVAASGFRNAVAIRGPELHRRGLPTPQSWADLADPVYRGLIAFPDPALSAAGTLALAGLVQKLGPEEAWPVIAAIRQNTALFLPSSWSCARAALDPATPIAVSVEIACLRLADQNDTIRVIVPSDASAVELEGFAMLAGTSAPDLCAEILAWSVGEASQSIARRWRKVTLGERGSASEDLLADGSFTLDHERAAQERSSHVAQFAALRAGGVCSSAKTSNPRLHREGLNQ